MQQVTHDVTRAIALARQVLPLYAAVYPSDKRLERALDRRSSPDEVEGIMQCAVDVAEGCDKAADAWPLFRACDAAECVWLALHPNPDIAELVEAAASARLQFDRVSLPH